MAHLQVNLSDEQIEALRCLANQRQTPVSELIRGYVNYLLAGGAPVSVIPDDIPSNRELAQLAETGHAFDWLADEPDLYSLEDGEPV